MIHTPRVPGAVMAASVILMVYGAQALLCSMCSGAFMSIEDPNNINDRIGKELPGYMVIEVTTLCITVLIGVVMIVCGIGLLQLMPTARGAAHVAIAADVFVTMAHNVYAIFFVIPVTDRVLAQQFGNAPAPINMANLMSTSMWGNVAFSIVLTLGTAGILLYLINSKTARAAFAGEYIEPPPQTRRRKYYDYDEDDDGFGKPPPKGPPDTGITGRS